jgi:hypothetical protein
LKTQASPLVEKSSADWILGSAMFTIVASKPTIN